MTRRLTAHDFSTMREAGKVAAALLRHIGTFLAPGITTKDIETFFDSELAKHPGMEAAFKGFMGYPASICVSVNEEIIHGIPSSEKTILEGDVVSVDLGIQYNGLFVDTAHTFIVGEGSSEAKRLLEVSEKSLYEGIKRVRDTACIGDIANAVQQTVETNGFSVIRKFVGHGIGYDLHLPPEVPNFGEAGEGARIKRGLAIAIEPMVAAGSHEVEILADGWTAKTKDNSLSAHFEHTVAVTDEGVVIITQQ